MKLDVNAVVRVTEQCNLDCSYCYMAGKENAHMDLDTVENILRKFQAHNDSFAHFTWIGGEPLLMPDSFFEAILELSGQHNPRGLDVSHSIQTNGIALTNARRNLLRELGFKIGISYDGLPGVNDATRVTRGGRETAKKVESRLLSGCNTIGTITVVTRLSRGKEADMYENLRRLANSSSLNFYAPTGQGLHTDRELLPSQEEAAEMMIRFYELWRDDPTNFKLRPFPDIVRSFLTGFSKVCDFSAISCYRIVGLDASGKVFTCSRTTHMPEAYLGDINVDDIGEILGADSREAILSRYLHLKKTGCDYFSICSGGCPAEARSHKGDFMEKTHYCCEARGALFRKVEEDLKDERLREVLESKV